MIWVSAFPTAHPIYYLKAKTRLRECQGAIQLENNRCFTFDTIRFGLSESSERQKIVSKYMENFEWSNYVIRMETD